jgi:hypothetical protein
MLVLQGVQVPGPAAVLGQLPGTYSQVTGREVVLEHGTTSLTPEQLALGGVLQLHPDPPPTPAAAGDGAGLPASDTRGAAGRSSGGGSKVPSTSSGGGTAQVIPPAAAAAGQAPVQPEAVAPPCPVPEGGAYSLLATAWGMSPAVLQLELPPAPAAAAAGAGGKGAAPAAKPGAPAPGKK